MTRLWYDTEFIDNGTTIDLISIGIVAEDGREYYAVSSEFDRWAAGTNKWLLQNVLPSLPTTWDMFWVPQGNTGDTTLVLPGLDLNHPDVKDRARIAADVSAFIADTPDPQLWAWYAAYDHVVLAQLWGRMAQLPPHVPMFTNDLKQECVRLGDPPVPQQRHGQHNALEDARHNRLIAHFLDNLAAAQ